jgi:hypothetical protein
MTEERLQEIEAREDYGCDGHEKMAGTLLYCPCLEAHGVDTRELLAEVRRLTEDRNKWKAAAEYHCADVIRLMETKQS